MNITKSTWLRRIHEALRGARERGASALEWALIAAIVVVAATFIGAAVYNVVQDKAADMENCANAPVGSNC
jgi:Flp pilus assembly pilin Flp